MSWHVLGAIRVGIGHRTTSRFQADLPLIDLLDERDLDPNIQSLASEILDEFWPDPGTT